MSTDPESMHPVESDMGHQVPSFQIDPDTPEEIAAQLQVDLTWLRSRPATRLFALRQFLENPASAHADSAWTRLTDKDVSRWFEFDEATEDAIAHDRHYRELAERGHQKMSSEAAAEHTFKIRTLRLELFLQRAQALKNLGNVSLTDTIQ